MQELEWQEIGHDSSNIERIAHYGNDLYVEFKNCTGYKCPNVPFEIFQRIMNKECISKSEGRPSYGATYDKLIKKAGFQCQQYK